ncbi:ABC transporter permease [Brevibacterium paucivorans]|uniref:ABC3 transporter permease C-terminal domain-containing protein n=1 Tax=Brevibacterium paucivorans TaxID=170994 RepID=A0A2N6VQC4_9MICO|nr:ABC transporter permease [Brevibacterium paucivorans]PMD06203.1 hypothetical protein CJ199_02150 [Brevibacterium paucivorans]
MIRLAILTFFDRWQLFVGTVLAVTFGVAIVHAGMTIILGVEQFQVPETITGAEAESLRQAASGASTLTGMTVMLGAFLTIFVVGSTFTFAIEQRRKDLAILRLTGVTAKQIRRILLGEALLVALLGAGAGAVLGFGLTAVQRTVLTWLGTFPEELTTPLQPAVLVLDVIAALIVCLAGAWGAARRTTKVTALDALRRSDQDERVMTIRRWIVAIIATVLTAVQIYFSTTVGGMLIPLLLGLGIVITASVAMSRFAPLLVPAVARIFTPWARRAAVPELAMSNLRDAIRRTASCAAPMIVLVSLVMGLQGILDTQTKAAATEPEILLNTDLIATGESLDPQTVSSVEGVSLAAPETVVPITVHLKNDGVNTPGPGNVVAVDPDAFRATHLQEPQRGELEQFDENSIILGPGLDSTLIADTYQAITVTINDEQTELTEAARMAETLAGQHGFYIDRAIVPDDMLADRPTTFLIQLNHGADPDQVATDLQELGASSVATPEAMGAEEDSVAADENRAVMAAIVGLGSLYALITVLSTLAISITQRRSEIATLRLSGLTRRQVYGTTILEALASTLIGLVLGAAAAVLALVGLWGATQQVYGTPIIAIPWALLGGITLLTAGLTAATALLATQAAMKPPAIQALGTRE